MDLLQQVRYEEAVSLVPDFPRKGILFYDLTSLFLQPDLFAQGIEDMKNYLEKIENLSAIACVESRGFILASPLSLMLQKPLILIRKAGKLARPTISESYELEYGQATLELCPEDVPQKGSLVLIDDVVATGGTINASAKLIERSGGHLVAIASFIDLASVRSEYEFAWPVFSLIRK